MWTGKDVSYDYLRVFGCKAFVHVPKDERSKLDAKTKQCIFLGYGHEEFGYKLWDPVERKMVRSRDVVFIEDQTIEDFDRDQMPSTSREYPVDLDPIPPPIVHNDHGGDEQANTDDMVDSGTPTGGSGCTCSACPSVFASSPVGVPLSTILSVLACSSPP